MKILPTFQLMLVVIKLAEKISELEFEEVQAQPVLSQLLCHTESIATLPPSIEPVGNHTTTLPSLTVKADLQTDHTR